MAGETGSSVDSIDDGKISPEAPEESRIEEPPTDIKSFLAYMGPAWIFTASQIGAGEALSIPVIAATLGMNSIWLLPVVGFTKVFGQYYLVSQAVVSGDTFLKWVHEKRWLRWVFYYALLGGAFQALGSTGHVGTTAQALQTISPVALPRSFWIIAVVIFAGLIIFSRGYNIIENVSTVLLWIFLAMIAITAIFVFPPLSEWAQGFTTFPGTVESLGGGGWYIVAIAFGWLGAGFNATIAYVWSAKDRGMGMLKDGIGDIDQEDLTKQEEQYLQGWRKTVLWQNVIASTLLVGFSMLIWAAAAQTLGQRGIRPSGFEAITQMGAIFGAVYGQWGATLLVIALAFVVFTSLYTGAYTVSRMWEDAFGYIGGFERYDIDRQQLYQIFVILFLLTPLLLTFVIGRPLILFSVGGILFAPVIGVLYLVAIYLFFNDNIPSSLQPQRRWALALGIFAALAAIGTGILGIL